MQRIQIPQTKKIGLIKIFRDDLEQIVICLRKECKSIEIIADEFKINEISDLDKEKRDRISHLRIEGFDPRFLLELNQNDAEIWIGDKDNVVLKGLREHIEEILYQKPRLMQKFSWLKIVGLNFLTGIVIGLSLVFIFFTRFSARRITTVITDWINSYHIPEVLLVICVLLFFAGVVFDIINELHHCRISLIHSKESLNFFKRNKDQILIAVINSVISASLGLLIGLLL